MPRLQLETPTETFDLDEQFTTGSGLQLHSGVTGLGLPNLATQWLEGAGDGATFRGRRALPRDIDLPLTVLGNRTQLKAALSRLARALAGECTLRFVEDDGTSWFTKVHRVGGGSYVYGADTDGETEVGLVVTVRAGDPYWTANTPLQSSVSVSPTTQFLPRLVSLKVSSSQNLGTITLSNPGDAPAYPIWVITGPGSNFQAVSPRGEVLRWEGVLVAGETLTINTQTGAVTDNTGASRYADLAPAPRLWSVPPGVSTSEASMQDTTSDSRIVCTWRPRKWMVI